MKPELSPHEQRVIGVLLEKQVTTPDQYPLSLNALVNACNQKSNRHPVLNLDESLVRDVLTGLQKRGLVSADSYRSRVEKYAQRFCNSEFGELKLTDQQVAVITELLLRGPQTPGELRARAGRMAEFADMSTMEATLDRLANHSTGAMVSVLPREPGKRESRYQHLFVANAPEGQAPTLDANASDRQMAQAEIDRWKSRCQALEAEIETLKQRLRALGEVC